MSRSNQANSNASGWTSTQAYVMAVICLMVGIAVGYLVRGSSTADSSAAPTAAAQMPASDTQATSQVSPQQLKQMADKAAEPLLQQLKTTPNDASLLARVGDVYYDAQQFNEAVDYYGRSLNITPTNTSVRTDMGTAYWYLGNPDRAIEEFHTVLKAEPNKANALMNLGIVLWQGKMDINGAIAAWQKLLDTNPNFENRGQIEQMIAQAKQHLGVKPGTKTTKPTM